MEELIPMESSASQSLTRFLERARGGSRSALGHLMASCRPFLRQRVRTRLPRELARKQDGSDLVQECQSLAVRSFAQFKGASRGEFLGWLARILDRRILQAMRFWREQRRDRRREQAVSLAEGPVYELSVSSTAILERLSRCEECERLKLAASWCREEDLEVISKHLYEGSSHDEIAAELGVATTAARQRYCRAVRRVGQAMQLLELMTRHGLDGTRQDVLGLHRFQGADPQRIADRLRLPRDLVTQWIAEAKPLYHQIDKDRP
jgi:RNA polymerase sigma factor (sigma-70 family)